ncbi:hypothetical protein F511_41346 [Dorcoceras hygrometricum]|uniref:Retrovirus-related Pol polyprotein from transposon TNT 1-94-like beta-barrel domain-containing protein n=1 Tax=Dorcoceras hygrometricum TaxID=472368 RepID=A0A2Z7BN34_9LAMI|nr:hypothetical protein F511_41346 [Dorcoceras hygrometricum]
MDLAAVTFEANLADNPRQWWVDTGATRTICSDKAMFSTYVPVTGRKLFMGNSASSDVVGIGKVVLKMTSKKAPGSDQIHRETGTSRLAAVDLLIRSTTGNMTPSSVCTRRADEFDTNGISMTSIGYPRIKASGESSTMKHRLLHASGPHPIPPPNDPN